MAKFSENELMEMTGKARETIRKRLYNLEYEPGKKSAKLYDSRKAFELIYNQTVTENGQEVITSTEASKRLSIKRTEQIDLEMEITRGKRIPLEVQEEINDRVFRNVAGLIKSHIGKPLDESLIADIFTELREMGKISLDEDSSDDSAKAEPKPKILAAVLTMEDF